MKGGYRLVEKIWYEGHPLSVALAPFSWFYQYFSSLRRLAYQNRILNINKLDVPVIVIGNIVVGGTGKTPLVIWLAKYLCRKGYRPGLVSRGYKGKSKQWPQQVTSHSNPKLVGDEAVLLARHAGCPVAAAPKRYLAAKILVERQDVNIIVCDDGLQHYSLARDIEIAIIDGRRRHGNGRGLPAGPLREPISRLQQVDMVVCNGDIANNEFKMQYISEKLQSVADVECQSDIKQFCAQSVHAVAGIGNPNIFFSYLREKGLNIIEHVFPDHHQFKLQDITFRDNLPVIMTEKDAVKCIKFASPLHWFLPVQVKMTGQFKAHLDSLLGELKYG